MPWHGLKGRRHVVPRWQGGAHLRVLSALVRGRAPTPCERMLANHSRTRNNDSLSPQAIEQRLFCLRLRRERRPSRAPGAGVCLL